MTSNWERFVLIRKIANICGIIQAIVWIILSILCLVFYYGQSNPCSDLNDSAADVTYTKVLSCHIYYTFLDQDEQIFNSFNIDESLLRPSRFIIFPYIYLIVCIFWAILSAKDLSDVKSNNKAMDNYLLPTLISISILIVCLIDFILFVLLMIEYSNFTESNWTYKQFVGIVMSIAARGFTLWFLNLFNGIYLTLLIFRISKDPPLLRYNRKNIPRPKIIDSYLTSSGPTSYINDNYYDDNNSNNSIKFFDDNPSSRQQQILNPMQYNNNNNNNNYYNSNSRNPTGSGYNYNYSRK